MNTKFRLRSARRNIAQRLGISRHPAVDPVALRLALKLTPAQRIQAAELLTREVDARRSRT